jgi:hypothetical protein
MVEFVGEWKADRFWEGVTPYENNVANFAGLWKQGKRWEGKGLSY